MTAIICSTFWGDLKVLPQALSMPGTVLCPGEILLKKAVWSLSSPIYSPVGETNESREINHK